MENNINEISGNSDLNPIFDIVNSIQSKLNENNSTNQNKPNEAQNNNVNKKDLSNLDISKMIEMLNSSGTTNNTSNQNVSAPNLGNLNLGTLMNFSNILGGMNKTDPRTNLLNSLKPFLRETRQKNIDTYVTLLGVMQAINLFSGKDRD